MKSIQVKTKSAYGRTLYDPDCEVSKLLAAVLAIRSFSAQRLAAIEAEGWEVRRV